MIILHDGSSPTIGIIFHGSSPGIGATGIAAGGIGTTFGRAFGVVIVVVVAILGRALFGTARTASAAAAVR